MDEFDLNDVIPSPEKMSASLPNTKVVFIHFKLPIQDGRSFIVSHYKLPETIKQFQDLIKTELKKLDKKLNFKEFTFYYFSHGRYTSLLSQMSYERMMRINVSIILVTNDLEECISVFRKNRERLIPFPWSPQPSAIPPGDPGHLSKL